jgi:hypothetical protein
MLDLGGFQIDLPGILHGRNEQPVEQAENWTELGDRFFETFHLGSESHSRLVFGVCSRNSNDRAVSSTASLSSIPAGAQFISDAALLEYF